MSSVNLSILIKDVSIDSEHKFLRLCQATVIFRPLKFDSSSRFTSPNISLRITLFNIYCDFYFLLFRFLFFNVIYYLYCNPLSEKQTSKMYLDNDKCKSQGIP